MASSLCVHRLQGLFCPTAQSPSKPEQRRIIHGLPLIMAFSETGFAAFGVLGNSTCAQRRQVALYRALSPAPEKLLSRQANRVWAMIDAYVTAKRTNRRAAGKHLSDVARVARERG
jgi:hypothetical protein